MVGWLQELEDSNVTIFCSVHDMPCKDSEVGDVCLQYNSEQLHTMLSTSHQIAVFSLSLISISSCLPSKTGTIPVL